LPHKPPQRLARFKIPSEFLFVDTLPRDPNGKLHRRRVRDLVRDGGAIAHG
jgi:acyl-CoA synthetase (AMP-forming)/AMP-acid ligase II